ELLRRVILEHPVPVTLVALAPQTNLALLLRTHPEVADNLARIVFMGGSASGGNATAVAEFNVWHDPEAASVVLGAGVPLAMYGLDVFERVSVAEHVAARLAASTDARTAAVGRLLGTRIRTPDGELPHLGWIGDAGAVCGIVAPELLRVERLPVRVELGGHARGQTVVDRRAHPGEDAFHGTAPGWVEVDVALEVDAERMVELFLGTVAVR
ncbi:nucleoside hydrolase, partial [Schumannella luteola]